MSLRLPAVIAAVLIAASPPLGAQSPSVQSPQVQSPQVQAPPAPPPPTQSPIERLAGQTYTLTANDDKCGGLVVAALDLRLMKRAEQGKIAPLAVTVQCAGEAPRLEASVSIAEASGAVLYKASGRTGAGFKGTQANFVASVIQNIFAP